MSLFLIILIQASFYSLLGLGYVLIYRATRVLNLAHGDLMVFGAYAFYQGLVFSGGNIWIAAGCSLVSAYALGVIIYQTIMRPLAGYPVAVGVLATIALGILLRSLVTLIWSGQTRYPIEYFKDVAQPFSLPGGLTISGIDALIVVAAALALVCIPWALQRLPVGIEMRGVAENPLLAAQRGINIHFINAQSWAAAALIAALAGVLYALKVRLGPDTWYVGLAGFAPALIGGMDSLRGVLFGAVIVAAAEVLAARYVAPQVAMAAPFLALLIGLWLRPWGLFGSHEELERI